MNLESSIFYHGTSDEMSGASILKEGILPDLSKSQGLARPVDGRIYMATNIKDSIPYLLGGAMAGHDLPEDWIKKSRYGYLFIIEGKDLLDIQPDEDQVGQAIHDEAFPWVTDYFDSLENQSPVEDEEGLHCSLFSQLKTGEYCAWIKAGHFLLPKLKEDQKIDIILRYGNIAHLGAVYPIEAWKFDKKLSKNLREDGSNFFELATKI
jgi:hypothetical protein